MRQIWYKSVDGVLLGKCVKYEKNFFIYLYFLPKRNRLSSSSVTFVHPTQAVEIFSNVSKQFFTLAIP